MTARPPRVRSPGGRAFDNCPTDCMTGPALDKIAPPNDYEDLIRLIHDRFEGMRQTCQRIALFLTRNSNDVAVSSANATAERSGNHASVTDPEVQLYKKSPGSGAMLCFMGEEDQKTVQWTVFPTQGAWKTATG